MLQDVAQMVSPASQGERIALQLGELPKLTLKPQPISSVFSRLMQNALRTNTNGEPISVGAAVQGDEVVVTVRDHGEGLPDKELRGLFEPGFRTRGSRVGASNWGLFAARQIVREHGGDISAARAKGGGTAASVRLPLDDPHEDEARRQPRFPGASRYNRREPPVVSSPTSFASTLSSRLRASGSALVGFLFPGDAERDPGFKEEIRRRSLRGVYILVGVTAFMPFLALLFHGLASLFEPEPQMSSPSTLVLLTLAGCALAATRTEQGRRHARPLAFAMGIGVSAILTWSNIFEDPGDTATAVLESLIDVMVVLIVALAAIPARPLQMFAFGLILIWIDLALASLAASQGLLETPPAHYYSGGHLIAVLCGALSGLTYQLLHNSYLGQRERLATQSRLLHSETAMSFARLSATLSHELNSPLGTLRSSVASLQTLAAKQGAPEANKERMRGLQRDLFDVSEKAVDKISKAVDLIQRFTNLDRAEVTQVEVDKMLQDVAQMVRAEDEAGSEIRLTTTTMPAVKLKPQPISSVFSRLMHNAVKASAGRGPVEVSAGRENDEILVSVRDHGEGLSSQELSELFQPGFRTRDGRVEASKWGLFTARQVIREHGGDISATRADNGGTRIVVRLPVDRATGSISE